MAEGDRSLTGNISASFGISYVLEKDLGNVTDSLSLSSILTLTNGVGSNQANRIFKDRRSVTAGTPDDLDLAGGSLTDVYGQTFTIAEIVAIYIKNNSSTLAEILQIGADGAAPISSIFGATNDLIHVKPGGIFLWTAPIDGSATVTATTADILQIASASGTISYDIIIIGRST